MLAALLAAPEAASRPQHRARANLMQYFTPEDYPPAALERHAEGSVRFRVGIDPAGRVISCTVTKSSNDPALDAATCAILLGRAQYAPARDARGRAVADFDDGRVTWRLPEEELSLFPFAPTRIVTRMQASGNGGIRCVMSVNSVAADPVDGRECGYLAGTGAAAMMRGAPAASDLTMIFAVGPSGVEAAAPAERDYGELGLDIVAQLKVAADGRLSDCRVTRRDIRPGLVFTVLPDPCAIEARNWLRFEPSSSSRPRDAWARVAVFLRTAPPPPRPRPARRRSP